MMILAIETATRCGSVAVVSDDRLLASWALWSTQTHSERLMPAVETILRELNLAPAALDAFAVSIGPGSFTGVRIALSAAKGLAYATGKPLIGVSTLEALANRHRDPAALTCPMIDAKRGEVFAQFFRHDADAAFAVPASEPMVLAAPKLLEKILQPTLFLGDGALRHRELIENALGERAIFAPPTRILPSAEEVALLALQRVRRGERDDPFSLEPIYLRKSDAELRHPMRQSNSQK
jgi:tRNA threonylcarbamoyladenosine biosynthesis protein TsaB